MRLIPAFTPRYTVVAYLGLAALGVVAVLLLRHQLTLPDAGIRGVLIVLCAIVLDRAVVPLLVLALGPRAQDPPGQ